MARAPEPGARQAIKADDRATRFKLEIGKLIRARRNELGITQTALAQHVGVSQQQIVKYEKGMGRIPADSLLSLCRRLQIDPGSIFYPLDAVGAKLGGFAESEATPFAADAFSDRDTVALVRAFQSIRDKRVRQKILELVAAIADDRSAPRRSRKKAR